MDKIFEDMIEELEDAERMLLSEAGDIGCTIGIVNAIAAAKSIVEDAGKSFEEKQKDVSVEKGTYSLNDEVMAAAIKLQSCFKGSRLLTDCDPVEFLIDEKSNTYFILGNCETKEDVDCKVLEWVSRAAYKTAPYQSKASNENFHRQMLVGINAYLGTIFDKDDMEEIYTKLGNACNHEKTLEFVRSKFDMDVLKDDKER